MAEIKQLFQVTTLPGIKRDGTVLDGDQYSDGQWVRFQRGRPKKMGGYQQISNTFIGPVRSCLVWSRGTLNAVYSFSSSHIEMVLVDSNGVGASIIDRTPAGFTADDNYIWSNSTLYNAGGTTTAVLAHASTSLATIDDSNEFDPYYADASGTGVFVSIAGTGPSANGVSGGVFSVAPYAFYISSDGYIQWSDANQPTVLTSGDAGSGRITGAKLVKGLSLRSGSGPAALLWSLDSVIRMDYSAGGQSLFRFSHLSSQTSILAQNSVIEYDGLYFWVGIDRFLMCDGSQVKEVPNQMNINWFFDNLNFAQRQKVWAMKVPRYGEIMWFFPYGEATECTHCVIYNVREQIWYDNQLSRSAGFYPQVLRYPVMSDSEPTPGKVVLVLSALSGTFSINDIVQGDSSDALATIDSISGTSYYLTYQTTGLDFIAGEGITNITAVQTATADAVYDNYPLFAHEKGTDKILGDQVSAIESFFITADFGYPTGGAQQNNITGLNRWTRLIRVEPDFIQEGAMSVEVYGKEFANGQETISDPYTFEYNTTKVDMREQRREIRLKFTSNEAGGHYEMGRVILHTEPGDVRS